MNLLRTMKKNFNKKTNPESSESKEHLITGKTTPRKASLPPLSSSKQYKKISAITGTPIPKAEKPTSIKIQSPRRFNNITITDVLNFFSLNDNHYFYKILDTEASNKDKEIAVNKLPLQDRGEIINILLSNLLITDQAEILLALLLVRDLFYYSELKKSAYTLTAFSKLQTFLYTNFLGPFADFPINLDKIKEQITGEWYKAITDEVVAVEDTTLQKVFQQLYIDFSEIYPNKNLKIHEAMSLNVKTNKVSAKDYGPLLAAIIYLDPPFAKELKIDLKNATTYTEQAMRISPIDRNALFATVQNSMLSADIDTKDDKEISTPISSSAPVSSKYFDF